MTFFGKVKTFVNSITTTDHYSSYDADTSGSGYDRTPLANEYPTHGPSRPGYSNGSRSAQLNSAPQSTTDLNGASGDAARGQIPLGSYPAGQAVPAPSVAWTRIDRWLESYYPELFDQILEGASDADLNELEHDLDCALPTDVRESMLIHDGQDGSNKPTGLFYGISFLDMERIANEWMIWRNTAIRVNELRRATPNIASSSTSAPPGQAGRKWVDNQHSVPADAVQPVYAHPGWIPMAKDMDGNNIGIDLAPDKKGTWGQVILFGREFDTKYVVAQSWGAFLDQFASDLESGQYFIDDDIEDAVFAYRMPNGRLASYLDVLRNRVEKAHPRASTPAANSGVSTPALVSPAQSSTNLSLPRDRLPRRTADSQSGAETVLKLTPTTPPPKPESAQEDSTKLAAAKSGFEDIDLNASEPIDTLNDASKELPAKTQPDLSNDLSKTTNAEPSTIDEESQDKLADNLSGAATAGANNAEASKDSNPNAPSGKGKKRQNKRKN